MTIEKFYTRISFLYLFIVLFSIQNFYFSKINFKLSFYEQMLQFVFWLSAISILSSLIILPAQTTQTINQDKINIKNIFYLILNLLLYYAVIYSSLYLGSQTRL